MTTCVSKSKGSYPKALFTNVPLRGAMKAIEKIVNAMPPDSLPVPKNDFNLFSFVWNSVQPPGKHDCVPAEESAGDIPLGPASPASPRRRCHCL